MRLIESACSLALPSFHLPWQSYLVTWPISDIDIIFIYTCALLGILPVAQVNSMKKLQNSAARLVTRSKPRDHITPVIHKLHWLPVHSKIKYRLCAYMYKITGIKEKALLYMCHEVHPYVPTHSLCSGKYKTKLQHAYGKNKFCYL